MKKTFALAGLVCALLGGVGCTQSTGGPKFAISESSVEARALRVLATRIDLRQPIFVQQRGNVVDVTYAVRQREGMTLHLDARTLEPIGEMDPFVYPRCSLREPSAHLSRDVARVAVDGGKEVTVFTSDEHNRAFARVGDGPAIEMSPEGMVVVGPARATTNGKDVVGVFVAVTDDGFALFATSMMVFDAQR